MLTNSMISYWTIKTSKSPGYGGCGILLRGVVCCWVVQEGEVGRRELNHIDNQLNIHGFLFYDSL
jgi:hypothetical protein